MTKPAPTTPPEIQIFDAEIVEIRQNGDVIAKLEDGRMLPIATDGVDVKVGQKLKLHARAVDPGGAPLNPEIK
jgi:hypothetical protein